MSVLKNINIRQLIVTTVVAADRREVYFKLQLIAILCVVGLIEQLPWPSLRDRLQLICTTYGQLRIAVRRANK